MGAVYRSNDIKLAVGQLATTDSLAHHWWHAGKITPAGKVTPDACSAGSSLAARPIGGAT